MKKVVSFLLAAIMVLSLTIIPDMSVYAASLSVRANKTKAYVGDSVTITVNVPSGYFAQCKISVSDSGVLSGGYDDTIARGDAAGYPNSYSFTLHANSVGSCTVTATCNSGSDADGNAVSLGSSSVTVNVVEKVIDKRSTDNTLKSLTVSDGTLSPAFDKKVTEYSMTVAYNVDKVSVNATANDAKAKVSVSGNEGLKEGANTITVRVTAENEKTRDYVIHVTKEEYIVPINETYDFDGKTYRPIAKIPQELIPNDFTLETVKIAGEDCPCLKYNYGELYLIYAKEDNGEGTASLFVYDEKNKELYPYVTIASESGFLIAMKPSKSQVPEGYTEHTLYLDKKGEIYVYYNDTQEKERTLKPEPDTSTQSSLLDWFLPETVYGAQSHEDYIYLMYGMNQSGEIAWYRYDLDEGTYMRYDIEAAEQDVLNSAAYKNLMADNRKLQENLKKFRMIAGIGGAALLAALIAVAVAYFMQKKKNRKGPGIPERELIVEELIES